MNLLIISLIIITFSIISILLRSLKIRIIGTIGEKRTSLRLKLLPQKKYLVINDLLLNIDGNYSQIDHVVISIYGIFVIETKSYAGWIYGSFRNKYWTQNIYGHKHKLYNPIFQNQGHVMFLKEALGEPTYIIPIVVFLRTSSIRVFSPNFHVIKIGKLLRTIRSYNSPVMTFNEVEKIYMRLKIMNNTDRKSRRTHLKQVKERKRNDSWLFRQFKQ